MSIKTKLRISGLISIFLILFVGAVLKISLERNNQAIANANKSVAISEAVSQLRFITFENLLYHDERTLTQLRQKSQTVSDLLVNFPSRNNQQKNIIEAMQKQQVEADNVFSEMASNSPAPSVPSSNDLTQNAQALLSIQLITIQQSQISSAVELTTSSQAAIRAQQVGSGWTILTVLTLMLAAATFNTWLVNQDIRRSLANLQRGANTIAHGRLDYRIHSMPKNEFGQLANSFNVMAESIDQTNKLKNQFIMLAAHQLRTPVGIIRWNVQRLQSQNEKMKPADFKTSIEMLGNASNEIVDRIDELLTTLEIEAQGISLNLGTCDPGALLQDIIEQFRASFEAKHITPRIVYPSSNLSVQADRDRLSAVMRQLISNAVTYTKPDGQINIKLVPVDDVLRFEISDSGIGIPPEEQSGLFTRFFRASNASTMMPDASGLGLYFVKHVVKAHGGRVGFKSTLGHGSTFWFEMPLKNNKTSTAA